LSTKKAFVTGGAGFIGSYLSEALLNQGYQVTVLDDLSTGTIDNIRHLLKEPRFRFVRASTFDENVVDHLISNSNIIFHLAAAVGVKLIIDNPVHTITTNIIGTETVLASANRYGVETYIASSSEVYGKGVHIPFSEDDDCLMGATTNSRWSYATSKAIDEFLGLAYHQQYNLPVVIMRFFNTIGPRQTGRYGMVVPRFVRQAINNEPITVYGDGQQSRCFTDVRDIVQAVLKLTVTPDAIGEVFNIGTQQEVTIEELARIIKNLTNSTSPIEFIPYQQAYAPGFEDMLRRVPNIDKLRKFTGFVPKRSLMETLQDIIEFEQSNLE